MVLSHVSVHQYFSNRCKFLLLVSGKDKYVCHLCYGHFSEMSCSAVVLNCNGNNCPPVCTQCAVKCTIKRDSYSVGYYYQRSPAEIAKSLKCSWCNQPYNKFYRMMNDAAPPKAVLQEPYLYYINPMAGGNVFGFVGEKAYLNQTDYYVAVIYAETLVIPHIKNIDSEVAAIHGHELNLEDLAKVNGLDSREDLIKLLDANWNAGLFQEGVAREELRLMRESEEKLAKERAMRPDWFEGSPFPGWKPDAAAIARFDKYDDPERKQRVRKLVGRLAVKGFKYFVEYRKDFDEEPHTRNLKRTAVVPPVTPPSRTSRRLRGIAPDPETNQNINVAAPAQDNTAPAAQDNGTTEESAIELD